MQQREADPGDHSCDVDRIGAWRLWGRGKFSRASATQHGPDERGDYVAQRPGDYLDGGG